MELSTCTERCRSIKKQAINTIRVFTEDNQVYIKKGKYRRDHIHLRWIPVVVSK